MPSPDVGMSSGASAPSSGSGGGKKDDERKKQFITTVLAITPQMAAHPVIAAMIPKYVKMSGQEDKAAFQLDLLRMLSVARHANVRQ